MNITNNNLMHACCQLDLIIRRVWSDLGRVTSGFDQKMFARTRPMTWSGRVGSGSGWVGLARNFMYNFRVGSDFFEFRIKYFSSYPACRLVRSSRVGFFSSGLVRVYWVGWPVIRFTVGLLDLELLS